MADAALLAWLEAKQLAPAFARAFDEDVGVGMCVSGLCAIVDSVSGQSSTPSPFYPSAGLAS